MRSFNRDYYVSCISVLHEQRKMIFTLADDMAMRLDELEYRLLAAADQEEDIDHENELQEAWESGYYYHESKNEVEKKHKPKLCMCDDCWSDADSYQHRVD